jgi:hypothetical protein
MTICILGIVRYIFKDVAVLTSGTHAYSVMFGDMIPGDPDLEHSLTPILKLIDFGSMRMVTRV